MSDTLSDTFGGWFGTGDDSAGFDNWWGDGDDYFDVVGSDGGAFPVYDEEQNFMNMGEFGDMGVDMRDYSINPTYQERLYEESGGDFYFEPEYDNRSAAKILQDRFFSALNVDKETAAAIARFAGAAFPKGGKEGDGSRSPKPPKSARGAKGPGGETISDAGRTQTAKLIAPFERARNGANALGNTPITGNQLLAAITGEGKPFGPNLKDPKNRLRLMNIDRSSFA